MGCYSKVKRKNMREHLQEYIEAHLQLSLGTIRQLKNELLFYRSPMFYQSHLLHKNEHERSSKKMKKEDSSNKTSTATNTNPTSSGSPKIRSSTSNGNSSSTNNGTSSNNNTIENWEGTSSHPLSAVGTYTDPATGQPISFYDHSTGSYYWPPVYYPIPSSLTEESHVLSPNSRSNRNRRKKEPPPSNKTLFCHMCGATDTPQWRKGPQGPHTLCNACGLHFNKKIKENSSHSIQPPAPPAPPTVNQSSQQTSVEENSSQQTQSNDQESQNLILSESSSSRGETSKQEIDTTSKQNSGTKQDPEK